jgi:hypothetical protein
MRWPSAWTDTGILRDSAIEAADPAQPGPDIAVVKGEWPGIRLSRNGAEADSGPTGAPWIDSNGFVARLAAARNPGKAVWIDTAPPFGRPASPHNYLIAMADAAAFGARWIISPDSALIGGLPQRDPRSVAIWDQIVTAARFFGSHQEWNRWTPQALIGILSDFKGPNEFFSQELLNLLDRAGMHNRVLLKGHLPPDPFRGLRAVLYADGEPLSPALRSQIGRLLIEKPKQEDDPYVVANDAVVRVSHRYDLVRCWNSGAFASNYVVAPDRSKAVVHMIFYADRGPDSASVRVAGKWRAAKISTVEQPEPRPVELQVQKNAVEVYLPQVSQYVALQLEA